MPDIHDKTSRRAIIRSFNQRLRKYMKKKEQMIKKKTKAKHRVNYVEYLPYDHKKQDKDTCHRVKSFYILHQRKTLFFQKVKIIDLLKKKPEIFKPTIYNSKML